MAGLVVSLGQFTDKGQKPLNQDFHGACLPAEPQRSSKGVVVALADGISSSAVSRQASEAAIAGFLADYYCTSDAWSVKTSGQRVLTAINSWLCAQTRHSLYRYDRDRGYVCTFSAMIIKSATAHIFHIGDARIFRLHAGTMEQLTQDHRVRLSEDQHYLARALGASQQLEIDYLSIAVEPGDVFFLATDGVYEYVDARFVTASLAANDGDLEKTAKDVVQHALAQGSQDNLTAQLVRIDGVPEPQADELYRSLSERPLPPVLEARMTFDGYVILRSLHASSRSHVYLARDCDTGETVVIKTPSVDRQEDSAFLERFLMEEWVARRVDSPHLLKPVKQARPRLYLYTVAEFIEGQTLAQWMIDHPQPELESVRSIAEQIARGLQALHRLEMLHQDIRPANIMIDKTGTVKIIDFGSALVAGLLDRESGRSEILGTAQYTAPEYFLGEGGSACSDLFSLAVIIYQMLTGNLPYGTQVAKARTRAAQGRLTYTPMADGHRAVPAWMDDVLGKALHPLPERRYQELSEFIYDLRHPGSAFLARTRPPLIDRSPLLFWKSVSAVLLVQVLVLLYFVLT